MPKRLLPHRFLRYVPTDVSVASFLCFSLPADPGGGVHLIALTQVSALPSVNLVLWLKANISMFLFGGQAVVATLFGLVCFVGCVVWRFVINAADDIPLGFGYLPGAAFIILSLACISLLFYHVNVGPHSILETGCLYNNPIIPSEDVRDMTPEEAGEVLFSRGYERKGSMYKTSNHNFAGNIERSYRRRRQGIYAVSAL